MKTICFYWSFQGGSSVGVYYHNSSSSHVCITNNFLFWIDVWPFCRKITVLLAFCLWHFHFGEFILFPLALVSWWEVRGSGTNSWSWPSHPCLAISFDGEFKGNENNICFYMASDFRNQDFDWLYWGLMTHQLFGVSLCCFPEKGRKGTGKTEVMKERDKGE